MRRAAHFIAMVVAVLHGGSLAMGQWVHAPTPLTCGDHWFFVGSPASVFAVSVTGVMVSMDHAAQWRAANDGLPDTYLTAAAMVGDTVLVGSHAGGLYRSTDHGATWGDASAGISAGMIQFIAAFSNTAVAFTDSGVSVTTDGGTGWTVRTSHPGFGVVSAALLAWPHILIGTDKGAFLSTDGGGAWTDVGAGLTNTDVRAFTRNGDTVYLGTYGGGVYRSTGLAGPWTPMNEGLTPWNVHALVNDGTHLWVGTCFGGVYVYDALHARWTSCNIGLDSIAYDVHALMIDGHALLLGTHNEIWSRPLVEVYTTISSGDATMPAQLFLSENYPNPFNPRTAIMFSSATTGRATLRVYDTLGREVATLFDGATEAGQRYHASFDGAGHASGTYVVRLVSGGSTVVKHMMLVK